MTVVVVMQLSLGTPASWEMALEDWNLIAAMSEQRMRNVSHCRPHQTPLASPLIHNLWMFLEHKRTPGFYQLRRYYHKKKVYFTLKEKLA
jgi:hypothetical protein